MGGLDVGLGQDQVALDHLQGGVTEQGLELVGVTAVAKEVDGKGVAKSVRVAVGDGGSLAEAVDELEQGAGGERGAFDGDEEGIPRGVLAAFLLQVAP